MKNLHYLISRLWYWREQRLSDKQNGTESLDKESHTSGRLVLDNEEWEIFTTNHTETTGQLYGEKVTLTSQTQNLLEIDHGYSVEGKMQKKRRGEIFVTLGEAKMSHLGYLYTPLKW